MPGPAFRRNDAVGLHTVEREDLEFLQPLRNDPAIRFGMTFTDPENMAGMEEWFEEHVSDTDEDEGAQFLVCPREPRPDGGAPTMNTSGRDAEGTADDAEPTDSEDEGPTPVGFVSLFDIERPAGHAEIAAYVDPRHQGEGYGTAAVRELVAYGIEERRLNKVVARALATNGASRTLLERVGFTAEETQRREKRVDGEFVDAVRYSILAEEWFDRPDTTRGIPDSPPGATAEARGHTNPFATETDGDRDRTRDDGGER